MARIDEENCLLRDSRDGKGGIAAEDLSGKGGKLLLIQAYCSKLNA